MNHDLHHFMKQLTDEMESNYKYIQKWVTTDPGTAGDQGEENWAQWLREWLSPAYEVVTKGRIVNEYGETSRQVDVLILKPFYSKKLHNNKRYISAGVAAAFECKTTLEASHIHKAMEVCVELKKLYRCRKGSPYKELHAPIAYGVLAHSHGWQGENSKPIDNIQKHLVDADRSHVLHPRQGLDFVCVADLGTWVLTKLTFSYGPNSALPPHLRQEGVDSGHLGLIPPHDEEATDFTPVGSFYANLMEWFAWEDPALRDIVNYYRITGLGGQGGGELPRQWDFSIYSEAVKNKIKEGRLSNKVLGWDEWKSNFGISMQYHNG